MAEFETPRSRSAARLIRNLKTIRCCDCKKPFKQSAPVQRRCSDCRATFVENPWPGDSQQVFELFRRFCVKYKITRARIIAKDNWKRVFRTGSYVVSSEKKRDLANLLCRVMTRFREGRYAFLNGEVYFQSPPWQPICPTGALYCRGAILPGDCPRHWKECLYSETDWKKVCEFRGFYESFLVKNGERGDLRRGPIIRGGSK